ncbi:hypothetical protein [Streptomyces sp. NPDC050738]|uniref:hypothetical protein n=1 Tax=Streptomyces sp. NPDC050738 TaxID=3154744 RepID=UPI0034484D36
MHVQHMYGDSHVRAARDALLTACRLLDTEHQKVMHESTLTRAKGLTSFVRRMCLVLEECESQFMDAVTVLSVLDEPRTGDRREPMLASAAGSIEGGVLKLANTYSRAPTVFRLISSHCPMSMLGVTSVLRTSVRVIATELDALGACLEAQQLACMNDPLDSLRARFVAVPQDSASGPALVGRRLKTVHP